MYVLNALRLDIQLVVAAAQVSHCLIVSEPWQGLDDQDEIIPTSTTRELRSRVIVLRSKQKAALDECTSCATEHVQLGPKMRLISSL